MSTAYLIGVIVSGLALFGFGVLIGYFQARSNLKEEAEIFASVWRNFYEEQEKAPEQPVKETLKIWRGC